MDVLRELVPGWCCISRSLPATINCWLIHAGWRSGKVPTKSTLPCSTFILHPRLGPESWLPFVAFWYLLM